MATLLLDVLTKDVWEMLLQVKQVATSSRAARCCHCHHEYSKLKLVPKTPMLQELLGSLQLAVWPYASFSY